MSDSPPPPDKLSYKGVNWAVLRREYEETEITIPNMAKKYGFKSPNTIYRAAKAQDWFKNSDRAAAAAATERVAELSEQEERREEAAKGRKPARPPRPSWGTPPPLTEEEIAREADAASLATKVMKAMAVPIEGPIARTRRDEHFIIPPEDTDTAAIYAELMTPEQDEPTGAEAERIENEAIADRDAREERAIRITAEMTGRRMAAQLAAARRIQGLGLLLTDTLQDYFGGLKSEDPEKAMAALVAFGRLTTVSDKDTLKGFLGVAGELVERGVILERRVLGMDIAIANELRSDPAKNVEASGSGLGTAMGLARVPALSSDGSRLLRAMGREEQMQYRDLAKKLKVLRRDVQIGKIVEPGGEVGENSRVSESQHRGPERMLVLSGFFRLGEVYVLLGGRPSYLWQRPVPMAYFVARYYEMHNANIKAGGQYWMPGQHAKK